MALYESGGNGCVSPRKDHWTNATDSWRTSSKEASQTTDHLQTQTSTGTSRRPCFRRVSRGPHLNLPPLHIVLSFFPDLFFSWFSTLTSFPCFWCASVLYRKNEKSADRQRCRQTPAHPFRPPLLISSLHFQQSSSTDFVSHLTEYQTVSVSGN